MSSDWLWSLNLKVASRYFFFEFLWSSLKLYQVSIFIKFLEASKNLCYDLRSSMKIYIIPYTMRTFYAVLQAYNEIKFADSCTSLMPLSSKKFSERLSRISFINDWTEQSHLLTKKKKPCYFLYLSWITLDEIDLPESCFFCNIAKSVMFFVLFNFLVY